MLISPNTCIAFGIRPKSGGGTGIKKTSAGTRGTGEPGGLVPVLLVPVLTEPPSCGSFLCNKVGELGWKDLLGLAVNNYA